MACANYWQSPFQVGSHHFARAFVRQGWEVGFVSDPISPVHLLGGWNSQLGERFHSYRHGGDRFHNEAVWAWVPGALVTPHNKPLLRSKWVWSNWSTLAFPPVDTTVRAHGFGHVDCVYVDSPIHRSWLDRISYRTSVYRVADNPEGFHKYAKAYDDVERELVQRVDMVVFAAKNLRERVERLRPKRMQYLPNGVEVDHFMGAARACPREYERLPRPIVVYVGAMAQWFDYDLVNRLAATLPTFSFVLIGPDDMARHRIVARSNVHLLGQRRYEELPGYLQHATVGIIPFDVVRHGPLVHSIHPLKLYEYLACGLPVVSVEWDELRSLDSPARLCASAADFVDGVVQAASETGDQEARRRYAAAHDWSRRATELRRLLGLEGAGPTAAAAMSVSAKTGGTIGE